jgi:dienelactone hydrolase
MNSKATRIGVPKVTRRDLGVAVASAAAVVAAGRAKPQVAPYVKKLVSGFRSGKKRTYTGPLDGFEGKVDGSAFNPTLTMCKLYESAPLRMTFNAKALAEAEQWQKSLRAKLVELMGGFPETRSPLNPETLEVRDFPGYRREKFVFESRPGLPVLGYLLTPKSAKPPYGTVIAIPGHGRGVDDVVGIDRQGGDRLDGDRVKHDWREYQYDYAIQVTQHGMAAVAIEPLGFGCRRDPLNEPNGLDQFGCNPLAPAALLFGQPIMGWRVYDVIRTIDWIETRKELDPARVGSMGISNGGETTIYAAAVEPRIRAAFVSGSLNTFRDSLIPFYHCVDAYLPGMLNWAELYDIAGLAAPRAFFAESGNKDVIFPIAGSLKSFERVKKIYEVFGAADFADHEVFDGDHHFWGKRGLPFLARHLA